MVSSFIPVLTGPTASGKSSIAIALAQRHQLEILCMDSMTVYRGLDIVTAKAGLDDQKKVPHHLLDLSSPADSFTVFDFFKAAQELFASGRPVLVVGGTCLYLDRLKSGLSHIPSVPEEMRRQAEQEYEQDPEGFYQQVLDIDPEAGAQIHRHDQRRLVRAMEVWRFTGKNLSQWRHDNEQAADRPFKVLAIRRDRDQLYRRCNKRVKTMVENGLLDEIKKVRQSIGEFSPEAKQAVGVKETLQYLDQEIDEEQWLYLIKRNTRHLAKHQITWLKRLADEYLDLDEESDLESSVQTVADYFGFANSDN